MTNKKIYVAGPMSGYEEMNFPAFNWAAYELTQDGWIVVNPVDINPDPTTPWKDCMIRDIEALIHCDAVYMLLGWENSRGATLEHTIAQALGLELHYEREDD